MYLPNPRAYTYVEVIRAIAAPHRERNDRNFRRRRRRGRAASADSGAGATAPGPHRPAGKLEARALGAQPGIAPSPGRLGRAAGPALERRLPGNRLCRARGRAPRRRGCLATLTSTPARPHGEFRARPTVNRKRSRGQADRSGARRLSMLLVPCGRSSTSGSRPSSFHRPPGFRRSRCS